MAEDGSKTETKQGIAKTLREQEVVLSVVYAILC